jgi:hypothetical protein
VTTSASCGAGKIATGGGCSLTSVAGQSGRLKQSEPTADASGWTCTCDAYPDESVSLLVNGGGTYALLGTSCTVRARAICAPNP